MTTTDDLRPMTGIGIGEQKVFNRTKEKKMSENNVVDVVGDTAVTDTAALGQDVATPLEDKQEPKALGADVASSTPIEGAAKPEEGDVQVTPEADASRHDEPADEEPAEPRRDLNNVTDSPPAAEPVQESIVDTRLDDVLRKLSAIESKLDTMSLTLDILARQKEESITRLNAELDKFKTDMRFDVKKSLISDIIDEVNLMSKEYRSLKAKSAEAIDSTQILEDFRLFAEEDFLECLERHQVYAIRTEAGKPFDNLRHIKRGKVPTDNPELDGKVCESISDGFEARLQMSPAPAEPVIRVLQREKVTVYSFTSSDTPANPPETTVEK